MRTTSFEVIVISVSLKFGTPTFRPAVAPSVARGKTIIPLGITYPQVAATPPSPNYPSPKTACAPNAFPFGVFSARKIMVSFDLSLLAIYDTPIGLSFFYMLCPAAAASSGILMSSFVVALWRLAPNLELVI